MNKYVLKIKGPRGSSGSSVEVKHKDGRNQAETGKRARENTAERRETTDGRILTANSAIRRKEWPLSRVPPDSARLTDSEPPPIKTPFFFYER